MRSANWISQSRSALRVWRVLTPWTRPVNRIGLTLTVLPELLSLWKDADPDIPILKEAKAEYTKLL